METSTEQPKQSIEPSYGYAEAQDKQDYSEMKATAESEDREIIPVHNTPFTAVRSNNRWDVIMGKYRLANELESKEDAIAWALRIDWDKIMTVIGLCLTEQEAVKEAVNKAIE